jgi:T5SS/PEP-CTERM-associated repeat protein
LVVSYVSKATVARWALFVLLLASPAAFSQTTTWTDGTGNWFTPANWSAGVPNSSTIADINNGGTAQITSNGAAASQVEIGVGVGEAGALSISEAGSLQDQGAMYIGEHGSGSLSITAGATVSSTLFALGQSPGSSGTATVSGSGSTWTNLVFCFVGQDGDGTLNITGGATVSDSDALVGGSSKGVAIVDGAGSSWVHSGTLNIGGNAGATGTLTISNGGNVLTGGGGGTFGSVIAYNTGSSGTVNVSGVGSTWMNNGPLGIGDVGGDGVLHITNGGAVSNRNCIVGAFGGGGNVTVERVDSIWTINGDLSAGSVFGGAAGVTILDSGHIASVNGFIAEGSSSVGIVAVNGAASTWTNSGDIYVGGNALGPVGIGELILMNGGTVASAVLTVWGSGTLYGNGFVQTNEVTNQGTLAPDQTISITGNLTLGLTANMSSTVTPDTAASVMVQGTVELNGNLDVTLIGGPFIQGTQYTLLLANGGLDGTTFSNVSITAPNGVAAQVTYDTNHVYLVIQSGGGSPTPTATGTPSATPTPTGTQTPTATPTITPSPTPTPTSTATATSTPSTTPRITPTPRSRPSPRLRPTPPPHITPVPPPPSPRPTAWPRPTPPPHISLSARRGQLSTVAPLDSSVTGTANNSLQRTRHTIAKTHV